MLLCQCLNDLVSCSSRIKLELLSSALSNLIGSLRDLCRRACKSEVGIKNVLQICSVPYSDVLCISIEDAARSHVSRLVKFCESCYKARKLCLYNVISVVVLTLNNDVLLSLVNLYDLLSVGNYRDLKMLGDLRTYLSGIAIDRLTAGDDQIIIKISQCTCDSLGCCPCISTAATGRPAFPWSVSIREM